MSLIPASVLRVLTTPERCSLAQSASVSAKLARSGATVRSVLLTTPQVLDGNHSDGPRVFLRW